MNPPRLLGLVALIGASFPTSSAFADEFYFYEGQRVPLVFDVSRLAIRGDVTDEALAAVGLEPEAYVEWPIDDWKIYDVPPFLQSEVRVRDTISALVYAGAVEFISATFVGPGPIFPTDHLIVAVDPELSNEEAIALIMETISGTIVEENWGGMERTYLVRSHSRDGLSVLSDANRLTLTPGVLYSEPDMIFSGRSALFPNDAGFVNCWGLHNTSQNPGTPGMDVDAPAAWNVTTGDPSVLVVVIDTGVQQDHPDLVMFPGTDVTSAGPGIGAPQNDFENHGTSVAGCVAATIDNGLGTVGLAPNCRCASARTFIGTDAAGGWTTQFSWTVAALTWADGAGARVTINSNSYGFQSSSIASKYAATYASGMVHFGIAGNLGQGTVDYPGSLPSVNAVSALDPNGNLTGFSNYGPGLAFSAPGQSIFTTDRTGSTGYAPGDYVSLNGTSYAAPFAAGVAALLLSVEPQLSAQEVEEAMQDGAVDRGAPGYDDEYGWGFVNAARTVIGCEVSNYCISLPNSTGNTGVIGASGSDSVTTNQLDLYATGAVPGLYGLFYYGPEKTQIPFGDGIQCVSAGPGLLIRLEPVELVDQNGTARRTVDLAQPPADAGPGRITGGSTWYFQFWYRDSLAVGGTGFNLTNGLTVVFCP